MVKYFLLCFLLLTWLPACATFVDHGDSLEVRVEEHVLYCVSDPDYTDLYICEKSIDGTLAKSTAVGKVVGGVFRTIFDLIL